MTDDWEVVIVVYCVAFQSPGYGYYIADRLYRTIRWLHNGPQEILSQEDARFRGLAEFWRHVASFPTHRFCSGEHIQAAYTDLEVALNKRLISDDESARWARSLDELSGSGGSPGIDATFAVARINQVLNERLIPCYYNAVSTEDSNIVRGLLASFVGLFALRQINQSPSEHPSVHTVSPPLSVAGNSAPSLPPSDNSSPRSSEYFTASSTSLNVTVTPALVGHNVPSSNRISIGPSPLSQTTYPSSDQIENSDSTERNGLK
ncbi:hypothetical protein FRC07_001124 [Ceratobasidium sp. 392]|nr:hypothetical protein FRC07_001124 [Ceratobasidium sp. 392]